MAPRSLSTDDIAFGRAVLLATDALALSAEGAFWLYDASDREWRFFLVTSLFHSLGPRELYLRLNATLSRKLSERETKEFRLFIGAPDEPLARAVRSTVATDAHASEPQHVKIKLDHRTARAVVYRMTPAGDEQRIRRARRRFVAMSKELLAA